MFVGDQRALVRLHAAVWKVTLGIGSSAIPVPLVGPAVEVSDWSRWTAASSALSGRWFTFADCNSGGVGTAFHMRVPLLFCSDTHHACMCASPFCPLQLQIYSQI